MSEILKAINALTIEYLTLYISFSWSGESVKTLRLTVASLIYSFYSLISPYLVNETLLLQVIIYVVVILVAKEDYTFREFTLTLSIHTLITLVRIGITQVIAIYLGDSSIEFVSFSVVLSLIFTILVVKGVIVLTNKKHATLSRCLNVEIDGNAHKGLYDTGNSLYAEDGKPVVVIRAKLCEKYGLEKRGELAVRTVSGIRIMNTVDLEYKVRSENGDNREYRTKAVVSDSLPKGYDLILHKEMGASYDYREN